MVQAMILEVNYEMITSLMIRITMLNNNNNVE